MNIAELTDRLREEGCAGYAIQSRGNSSDAFCLDQSHGEWKVFYTERGNDSPPIHSTTSESDACEFFLKHMLKQNNWNLVAFFKNEENAKKLESQLRGLNLNPIRNDITSYARVNDPRYRVFVAGRQIHAVPESFGTLPIED